MKIKQIPVNSQSGQFLMLALVFISLILINSLLLISRTSFFSKVSSYTTEEVEAINLSEAGLDKAIGTLNKNPGYSGEVFALGGGEIETSVGFDPDGSILGKIITVKVYIPNQQTPRVTREVKASADKVVGIPVPYVIHAGTGGLYMGNNTQVTNLGSVLSSGPVLMGENTRIDGSLLISSGTTQLPEIEQSECNLAPSGTCMNFNLGGSPNSYDASQSFTPTVSGQLTKAAVQVRRHGNPTEGINLYISGNINSGGRDIPNHSQLLGTGQATPPSSYSLPIGYLTDNNYAWVEVNFSPAINLTSGTKYWLSLESQSYISDTNYYEWRYFKEGGLTPTPVPTSTPVPTNTPVPTPTIIPNSFGFTSIGTSNNSGATNSMDGARFTTGATAGQVISMTVYFGTMDANASKRSFQAAIYSNITGNNPGSLVASSSTGTAASGAWITVPISATLSPNTIYWLFLNTNGDNNMKYSSGTTGQSGYKAQTFGTWPASFGSITKENTKYSIYATFGAGVTPSPTLTPVPTSTPTPTGGPTPTPGGGGSGYQGGYGAYSYDWDAYPITTYPWFDLAGDLLFKLYITPTVGSIKTGPNYVEGVIDGTNGSTVGKDIFAHTIKNQIVSGDVYYQGIDNLTKVGGLPCLNSKCHPGSTDLVPEAFPITSEMVEGWKNEASAGGIVNGPITMNGGASCQDPLGSVKIIGNVTINNCTIILQSPIHITGNLTIQSNNTVTLDPSFGKASGVVVVDGTITVGSNNDIRGTGAPISTVILNSEFNSTTTNAISVTGSDNFLVVAARNGTVFADNINNTFELMLGKRVFIKNSSGITVAANPNYLSLDLSAGTGGQYSIIRGTYRSK